MPIEIQGENLDLATHVWFIGFSSPVAVQEKSPSRLLVRTPEVGRWMRTGLWVSALDSLASAADTLPGFDFVGPLIGDTLVYEFRQALRDTLFVLRWPDGRMPLKVYIPVEWPRDVRAVVLQGIEAWRDVAGPGVPSFVFVQTPAAADVVWGAWEVSWCLAGSYPEWELEIRVMERAFSNFCNPEFVLGEGLPHTDILNLVVRETGNTLGLWRASPHASDVMGGAPFSETGLSRGDSLTLRRLYELPAGFQP